MTRHIADTPGGPRGAGRLKRFAGLERREHPSKRIALLRRKPRTRDGLRRLARFLKIERATD